MSKDKKIATKPMLYAHYLFILQEKAKELGYNLIINGSMARDCDLVAVGWVDDPAPSLDLIDELNFILQGWRPNLKDRYQYTLLPGGRESYVISMNRGGYDHYKEGEYVEDPMYYLDISVISKQSVDKKY